MTTKPDTGLCPDCGRALSKVVWAGFGGKCHFCGSTNQPHIKEALAVPSVATDVAIVENMSDVITESVEWLWPNRVAIGKLNLLVGIPGLGKSMVTLDLTARITAGLSLPDGGEPLAIGNVVIMSAEDASSDTIKPRLDKHGADTSRVDRLVSIRDRKGHDRPFTLKRDLAPLEVLIAEKKARLLIVDPVSAYLGDKVNAWSDAEMRAILGPLSEMAEKLHVAIWGIMHLTKDSDRPAILRVPGSIANAAAARVIQSVLQDPEDEERRFLAYIKNNLGPKPATLAFDLKLGCTAWSKDPVPSVDANYILSAKAEDSTAVRKAVAFLECEFDGQADGEWLPAKPIEEQAHQEGISKTTLWTARKRLGIEAKRVGGKGGTWQWAKVPKDHPVALIPEPSEPSESSIDVVAPIDLVEPSKSSEPSTLEDSEDSKGSEDSGIRATTADLGIFEHNVSAHACADPVVDGLVPGGQDLIVTITARRLLEGLIGPAPLRADGAFPLLDAQDEPAVKPARSFVADPRKGHHTASQCPFKGCPGPHAPEPSKTVWTGGFTDPAQDPDDSKNDLEETQ